MIYTITFNPALDYIVKMDDFNLGHVNRSENEYVYAGGKGINVSIVLNNLEVKSKALGFIAGFTGEEIEKRQNKIKLVVHVYMQSFSLLFLILYR